jgi:hypothetical protein
MGPRSQIVTTFENAVTSTSDDAVTSNVTTVTPLNTVEPDELSTAHAALQAVLRRDDTPIFSTSKLHHGDDNSTTLAGQNKYIRYRTNKLRVPVVETRANKKSTTRIVLPLL